MGPEDIELYEKHAAELTRFATVLSGPAAAEDLVASAVVRVFTSPRWSEVRDRRAYLFKAVLFEARQVHRSTGRRERREAWAAPRSEEGDGSTGPDPGLRVEVVSAMRALTVRQRAVLYLTYWADLEADDVATELGISRRTVQRELTDARRAMEVLLR